MNCPKRQVLFLPMVAAVLAGVVLSLAGCSRASNHPQKPAAWVPPGNAKELADKLPSVNEQDLAQGKALRSTSAATHSQVRFNNRTTLSLELFWIDYTGQLKKYGTIPPNGSHTQDTFATHPWLLVDDFKNNVALYVSEPGVCVANITNHP